MKKDKRTILVYLGTGGFLLTGLICIVCGYGFADGWDKIAEWFTSRWAIYVYVFLGFYLLGMAYLLLWGRRNGKH